MRLQITIDIFSGRKNPILTLTPAESRKAIEVLSEKTPAPAFDELTVAIDESTIAMRLGYRGLIITQLGDVACGLPRQFRVGGGSSGSSGAVFSEFERYSLGLTRNQELKLGEMPTGFLAEVTTARAQHRAQPKKKSTVAKPAGCPCAPIYEPTWWNDGGPRQNGNNCYNYACNHRTDSFAQPGKAAGSQYLGFNCADLQQAALADDLLARPNANNKCPKRGHLVALVVAPGYEFHWYRLGRDSYWSHKIGSNPATNLDNSGNWILDPRLADRGPYTDFCTFMLVMHGHIKIE